MFLKIIAELPLSCLPVKQKLQPFLYFCILFLLDGKDRLESLYHRAPVIFFHPCCKRDQLRLDLYPGPGNFHNVLHLREIIVTGLRKPDHISFDLPAASSERHQHFHPRFQFICHALRNAVLKDLIQFFMLYVYDNVRKHSIFILLSAPQGPPRSGHVHP